MEKITKGTFGDTLKREREMRGVSLEEITAATRIASRFLQAIEDENWEQLPGGVFNRGFVRSIARYLGLDEENTVAEYALAVDERPVEPVWTVRPPPAPPDRRWLSWVLVGAIIFVLVVGGWFATRGILAWRATRRVARAAAINNAAPPAAPAVPPVSDPSTASATASAGHQPGTAAGSAGLPAAATPTPLADSAPSAFASAADPSLLVLLVEAGKKTKVTIEGDADRLFEGTMKAGDKHVFSAKDHFEVSAKDAGALLLELNGKTLAPIGPPGKNGKVTLTRDSLKTATGGGN
jgi:cytoskeleton protein RodZ